jgi:hypothetical protein
LDIPCPECKAQSLRFSTYEESDEIESYLCDNRTINGGGSISHVGGFDGAYHHLSFVVICGKCNKFGYCTYYQD